MQCFVGRAQAAHSPKNFLVRGRLVENREVPERAAILEAALGRAGHKLSPPEAFGLEPVLAIHSSRYLDFLREAAAKWSRLPDAAPEVLANAFAMSSDHGAAPGYPNSIVGRAGFHMGDLACPIGPGTWLAAYEAARIALSAAAKVGDGARAAYGLCRPPGHHAFAERAAGFSYLNNAGLAAQWLRNQGAKKVAILDVDVHHGNGTQDIFYDRADVFFASLHGDPADFYPFFWGYEDQKGSGPGEGLTCNAPLPLGSGDVPFLAALDRLLERIAGFGPEYLVVSLGLDASVEDPFAALAVTTDGFAAAAQAIADLGLPTALLQEGGYVSPSLGDNLIAFLDAFGG
jgi:acetoin utilization deacetylase AcuC-like enzyme